MFGLKQDWSLDVLPRYFTLDDYEAGVPRWCAGCGDHGILSTVQRICRDKQLLPEKTVCVSGIGCSSRFPITCLPMVFTVYMAAHSPLLAA